MGFEGESGLGEESVDEGRPSLILTPPQAAGPPFSAARSRASCAPPSRHTAPPGRLDASAASPPARQRRRHTYAEFDETRSRRATSGGVTPLREPLRGPQPHFLTPDPPSGGQATTIRIPHSLGVLASRVPRDAVDEAIEEAGKTAKRAGGKLPHVMVYFAMALALFADEDYETDEEGAQQAAFPKARVVTIGECASQRWWTRRSAR